jgi:molybdopterin synthase catalytic subunit
VEHTVTVPDTATADPTPTTLRIRVRLFAIQRELAGTREVALEMPRGAAIEDAWSAVVERHPGLAPGRPSVRFARNGDYAEASTPVADNDEIAFIPPVSGGSGGPASGGSDRPVSGHSDAPAGSGSSGAATERRWVLEIDDGAFPRTIAADLEERLATSGDGAVVTFIGRTRESPGTPAPGQEAEAARHAGRTVDSLGYEAHESMAVRVLETIAEEIEERFGVTRLAIVHRTGEVPLGEASIVVVAVAPHRDAAFLAARYAIDETKARAPIWKAERFTDGHVWIGEPARVGPAGDANRSS